MIYQRLSEKRFEPARNQHLAEELAEMSLTAQRLFLVESIEVSKKMGITLTQYIILGILSQHTGLFMSELARLMNHAQSTATGMVSRLMDSGLVERVPHSLDQRKVVVQITEKGEDLLKKMRLHMVRNLREMFTDLSQKDVDAWLRVYRALHARFTSVEIPAIPSEVSDIVCARPDPYSERG